MSFRSEKMNYFDLKISADTCWDFIDYIGCLKMVHFMDHNKDMPYSQRHFFSRLAHCEAVEEKLNRIEKYCQKFNKEIKYCENTENVLNSVKNLLDSKKDTEKKSVHTHFTEIEEIVNKKYDVIKEICENYEKLETKKIKECEYYNLLKNLRPFIPEDIGSYHNAEEIDEDSAVKSIQFFYFCGVLPTENLERLQRLVFRISRGNTFLNTLDLTFDNSNKELNYNDGVKKSIYFLVFQLGSNELLKQKLTKALESVKAEPYLLPANWTQILTQMNELESSLDASKKIILESQSVINEELNDFVKDSKLTRISYIEEFRIILEKERCIIHTLNKMKFNNNGTLDGKIFITEKNTNFVKNQIEEFNRNSNYVNIVLNYQDFEKKRYKPPTYVQTDDFSAPFQQIVDTYGVPRYGEVNPGFFTLVTFPYLFGVMFGDIGHGFVLFAAGYYLVSKNSDLKTSGLKDALPYRYLFLLMGFFAFYCGLVYNDFLSIPWNLFGSCYTRTPKGNEFIRDHESCTYIFGFDPIVFQSKTEVGFLNSFKMKLSVIIGVTHMCLGICMKAVNSIHFGSYVDFFFEFLPQLTFMLVTFGYMCVAIIIKWLQDWGDGSTAPSIISIFINMGVAKKGDTLWGDEEGIQQTSFQQKLFLTAFIAFWLMLIPKPLYLAIKARFSHHPHHTTEKQPKHQEDELKEKFLVETEQDTQIEQSDPNAEPEEEHEISEIFVHQMIEVIEFILGSVSNTASYLRLWALSLAHGQLAKVFFEMTMLNAVKSGNAIVALIGFPIFIGCTVAVLMIMDVMECFLHTLRLHWVEFQNKFFKGDGYPFTPLNFSKFIDDELLYKKQLRFK
jgi:V-type H+-transporting ATPase subunit a